MSQETLHLANAPIIEAVLDIECDFGPAFELAALEEPSRQRFCDRYPKVRTQFMQELQIEAKPVGPIGHSTRQGVQAYQFVNEDEMQIVQVRGAGYSFNRLAPYTSFDDYLPEIRRTWEVYRELAAPVQIRTVRLRYINRILLPLTEGRVQLDDYFKIGPRLPDEDRLTFVGFLNQCLAVEEATGHQVTTVLTAQRQQEAALPVIFDNTVTAVSSADPADWAWLEAKLLALRALKNRVFKNTLSDKCLNLFQ